ncbi:MAG: leucine-rich repeat protein, partial [Lachnospiraceae bacterium]|nr:leucine-rich repeat protein [Lachnospiraceae bacterium]
MRRMKSVVAMVLTFTLIFTMMPTEVLASTMESKSIESQVEEVVEPSVDQVLSDGSDDTVVIEDIATFQSPQRTAVSAAATGYETTISGTVKDVNGNGMAQVAVTIFDITNGEGLYAKCYTNAAGKWSIDEAWIGDDYAVSFYKAGCEASVRSVRCTAIGGGVEIDAVTMTEIPGLVCNEADYTFTTDTVNETATITGYTGSDWGIILPSTLGGYPVVAIKNNAFANNGTIVRVALPETIKYIGDYAFYRCDGLTEIWIPDSVTGIDWNAFYNCTNLSSITYPMNFKTSGGSIFAGCSSLKSITVP